MSRVLLIKCNQYVYPYAMTHPLGVMHLSATLKRDGSRDVKIIDTRPRGRMPVSRVSEIAAEFKPDIIGLSSLIVEAGNLHETAAALKKSLPSAAIIAGGPYPSSSPELILNDKNIDCAVIGEGENAFLEIVSRIENNRPLHGIPGTAARVDGQIQINNTPKYIDDINTLPFPDWDAIDIPAYFNERRFSNTRPGKYMTLFTSRSCPYNCIYCHNIFGKGFRARSAQKVIEEITIVNERYSINEFEIVDDTFNLNRNRLIEICDSITSSSMKLKLYFPNALRSDLLDKETVAKLKAAGTVQATVAIETATPRLQTLIKKNLNIERAREAIGHLTNAGIFTHGFFMLGFPGETGREMNATVSFALRSRLHTASFFIVKPAPGTELHDMVFPGSTPDAAHQSYSYQSLDLTSSELPPETLGKIYRRAFARFYINPFRMARIFLAMPDKSFLLQSVLHSMQRIFPSRETQGRKTRANKN